MKLNSNFLCGLPSSRKLHNPKVRQANRLKRIGRIRGMIDQFERENRQPSSVMEKKYKTGLIAQLKSWLTRKR